MNEKGKILENKRVNNTADEMNEYFGKYPKDTKVVVEATGNWMFFYETIEQKLPNVTLAHPLKVKAIASARIKTDTIDSTTLAHLSRANLVPAAYIPPREVRDLRELLRYRASLVSQRTGLKCKIQSILIKNGTQTEIADAFGKKGTQWLREMSLRESYRMEIDGYLRLIEATNRELKTIQEKLDQEIKVSEDGQRLMGIPGLGVYSALLVLSEIGDIQRFPSPKKLNSYAGLVPSTYQSAKKERHGGLTKQGSKWLRWIMVENSHHIIKKDRRFKDLFDRVARKHGNNSGRVAVARKMLEVVWFMLTRKEDFRLVPIGQEKAGEHPGVME
jgi:transposase